MGFWKVTLLLALSILAQTHVGVLQAASISMKSRHYSDLSPEEEPLFQLAAYALKMKAPGMPQNKEVTRPDISREKRCSNLSTCVLGTYTQDLNRFHTYPQTAVGVGAPGRKRFMPSGLERARGSHNDWLQNAH